ncbi:DUF2301 domain-containing membrane protein [Vibrio tapetis]|uniref:Arabinose efflux permease n=1 Tax=Vibrio tapetis subsp. tapetis TaxID=1671868 RepID=A0A2N8ZCY2_9VIBR|nr:DUF2301 domain-containing membrane protein [Vibrio tapetis]SON49769.1 conserved membrane protein of unknown function [Vibrio tapetis subsp. tapetis]
MANTEHQEKLDKLDRISVCLYRSGITLFSLALLCYSLVASNKLGLSSLPESLQSASIFVVCISSALAAANLHVYNKHVRAVIVWSAWLGLLIMLCGIQSSVYWLALGFIFVTFSGIALKESFCFNVYGLKLVPILLALNTLFVMLEYWQGVMICSAIAGTIMLYLSVQKWRMPLHFDIGNKANYEV